MVVRVMGTMGCSVWFFVVHVCTVGRSYPISILLSAAPNRPGIRVGCRWASPSTRDTASLRLGFGPGVDWELVSPIQTGDGRLSFFVPFNRTAELTCGDGRQEIRYRISEKPNIVVSESVSSEGMTVSCRPRLGGEMRSDGKEFRPGIRWWFDETLLDQVEAESASTTHILSSPRVSSNPPMGIDPATGDLSVMSANELKTHCLSCQVFSTRFASHVQTRCWSERDVDQGARRPFRTDVRCNCVVGSLRTAISSAVAATVLGLCLLGCSQRVLARYVRPPVVGQVDETEPAGPRRTSEPVVRFVQVSSPYSTSRLRLQRSSATERPTPRLSTSVCTPTRSARRSSVA